MHTNAPCGAPVCRQKRVCRKLNQSFRLKCDSMPWSILPGWGCGNLTFQSHNLPTRLRALLLDDSRAETAVGGTSQREIELGMLSPRSSFMLLHATCTDGGAHRYGAWPQVWTELLAFAPQAASRGCLSPIPREFYPHDSSGGIHEPTGADELR